MGRPKAVILKNFKEYNLFHTEKTKMFSGVSITSLYPVKETDQFYRSIETWCYCTYIFKCKKRNVELTVSIPTIIDEKTISFLNKHIYNGCLGEHQKRDLTEAESLLDRVFPDRKKVFFYELDKIIGDYIDGNFERFDCETGMPEPLTDDDMLNQRYYNWKFSGGRVEKLINVVSELTIIGRNAVCYPVAFTRGTADWYMEKHGKTCPYAHAGEIFFVSTPDTIFFNVARHY